MFSMLMSKEKKLNFFLEAGAMSLQMVGYREYHLRVLFQTICTCLCAFFLLSGYSERVKLHHSISVGKLALSYGIVSLSS